MSAYQRFIESMVIDFDKWHDGTGYDLEAIDQMSTEERDRVVTQFLEAGVHDWRELEALERIGTDASHALIFLAREDTDPHLRLAAHTYGPEPGDEAREKAIVALLESGPEPYSRAMDLAVQYATPAVQEALVKCVRDKTGGIAYHAASALCAIGQQSDSQYDDTHRPLFLRLAEPDCEDRRLAVQELSALLGRPI